MIEIEAKGRFATALKAAVESNALSLADLAAKVDSTYEHMRKLVAGRAYPSIHLTRTLAHELDLDRHKLQELIEADKLHSKYKKLPKFLGISPELEPFEAVIPRLSPEHRSTLLAMAKTFLKQETLHARADRTSH